MFDSDFWFAYWRERWHERWIDFRNWWLGEFVLIFMFFLGCYFMAEDFIRSALGLEPKVR